MDVVKAAQLSGRTLERVVVHPLVLLSIVDHYNRVARDTRKRVVGVLLGTSSRGSVDVTNSYAVPFEEDDKDPRIWFLDHNYHESMFSMFKRINAKEHVVGWYSTGPKLRENDLDVHALFNRCGEPASEVMSSYGCSFKLLIQPLSYRQICKFPNQRHSGLTLRSA
ncbi:26S proteasome non-ATPase regulatory subunit 7 homolog A [Zea mays]|uniref:26S proteasome non-ATPase regulatory subunit 7 homolog A n=1 Tax=Zea mays TaxID=4577 RepID=A0A1D6JGZ7_MAIZE|nr:26S proteasome non-ATPase regulatory subunit 7 homolog A [Zea mays]